MPHPEYTFSLAFTDDCTLSGIERHQALREHVDAAFAKDAARVEDIFGPSRQSGPDRDTQFLILHSRAVLRRFHGAQGHTITCDVGLQESVDVAPTDDAPAIAWSLDVRSEGYPWSEIAPQIEALVSRLAPLGMRTMYGAYFSNRWLEEADAYDPSALPAILALQLEETRRELAEDGSVIDLQRLPRQDLNALLLEVEAPERVRFVGLNTNQLEAVPEALRRFTGLERLNLYSNPIEALPDWLADFNELIEVNAHSTRLEPESARARLPEGCRLTL